MEIMTQNNILRINVKLRNLEYANPENAPNP